MAQDYQPDEERSLSRTFFVLSIILVVASLYTVVDETIVRRPWKHYQTTFYELEYDQLRADLQAKEELCCPPRGSWRPRFSKPELHWKAMPSTVRLARSWKGLETAWPICCRSSSLPKAAWTPSITNTRRLSTREI